MRPPSAGEEATRTCAVPTVATSDADIEALNTVASTNVVGRSRLFHRTIDDAVNPLPLTVIVNGTPTNVLVGESDVTTGTGLGPGVTVIAGLVAARMYPLFRNNLNSYVPAVDGIVTVDVRLAMLAPT